MSLFGRIFGNQPPKIPAGSHVLLESVPVAGIGEGTLEQRPYWVMLDADHQEIGDRHYLTRQTFSDLTYATAYCAWVEGRGSVPKPSFPDGAV